jgi:hypothetical protein
MAYEILLMMVYQATNDHVVQSIDDDLELRIIIYWNKKTKHLLKRCELAEINDDDDERLLRWKDDVDDLKKKI